LTRATVPEPRIAGCVFVHVPRTAGSSIWQSLARLAEVHQIPVFDIYGESKHRYGVPEASDRVLEESVERLAASGCFFHHHTAENIFRHFKPGESVFATVLRDPVERFVSDIYHYRRFIRSTEPDSPFALHTARFWSARFTSCLRRDEVDHRELLDLGLAEDFFRNYYVNYFASLCWSEEGAGGSQDVSGKYGSRELLNLAREVRQKIQIIGDFSDLQRTFSRIQTAFRIPPPPQTLALTINRGESKPKLTRSEWRHYADSFAADYYLLEELWNLNSIHKSFRRACRALQGIGTNRRAA